MYADVVFPIKLPPLTYKLPVDAPPDMEGRIVKAPLMGKSRYGLVVSVTDNPALKGKDIKEIQDIRHRFVSGNGIKFLKWISDYYLAPIGIALKSGFFEEAVKSEVSGQYPAVSEKIKEKKYETFLFHAPSIHAEHAQLKEFLNPDTHGAVILAPEINEIERIALDLEKIFGERLCVLHSKLSKAKRTDAVRKIISGESDIVIGTRSAVFAPLKNISLIAALGEHSPSYKAEESPRYNARDAAVMRGFIEKSCVLLSSTSPSIESVCNAKIGKYTTLVSGQQTDLKRPKIKIVDMKKEKASAISGNVLKEAKATASKNGNFLFLVNRKGYSLIGCDDCGHIIRCGKCGIPLVFYKHRGVIRCNYCGREETVPEGCEECKGFNIKPLGAGIEKIREAVEDALKTDALIVEKTKGRTEMSAELSGDLAPLIIGTAYAMRKLGDKKFDAAAILNADSLMSRPDFRAHERTLQDIIKASQMVRPEGSVYLQAWNPHNKILRFIRDYDFKGFYEHEISQRKMLDYPPFSKIVLFNISYKKGTSLSDDVRNMIESFEIKGLEVLGPVEIPPILMSYPRCIQILLKSKDSRVLHSYARQLLNNLEKIKDLKINADVDPLKV